MNRTSIEHAIYAMLMQAAIGLLTGDWLAGAAFGVAFFAGREHAQAEDRYIAANGGKRYETPVPAEFGALHPKYWSKDSVLDLILPAMACAVIYFLVGIST